MRVELKPCPKCNSQKVYIEGGEIIILWNIKRTTVYVYCEQCGYKGMTGHTNTSAIAYWNGEARNDN